MLSGQGTYQLGPIEVYNSKTIPTAPGTPTAIVNGQGDIALSWTDLSNATTFNLYRSSTSSGTYTKIKSGIKTSDVPYVVKPTESLNYYKVAAANATGESSLSAEVEVVTTITGTEPTSKSSISVYPNPCNGKFFIQTNGEPVKSIRIFDSLGAEKPADTVVDSHVIIVDMHYLKSGIYFLILNLVDKTVVAKIFVQ